MHKVKHAEHHKAQGGDNREMPVEHRNTYEQWRILLEAEHIIDADGMVDLEKLEKRYPDTLTKSQIVWIEAMQKGEIVEEGDDVELDEPVEEDEVEEVAEVEKVEEPEEVEEASEKVVEEDDEDEDLAPPPLPGESNKADNKEPEKEIAVGDTLKILIDPDGEPEEVTVAKIAKDGIHLASSLDENTEYLVDPAELQEMIVE